MNELFRTHNWYNPFFIITDGGQEMSKEIGHIFIFRGGEVIASTQWLSNSNNPYSKVNIPFDGVIREKRKKDLTSKTVYVMRPENESSDARTYKRDLYIHADLLDGFTVTESVDASGEFFIRRLKKIEFDVDAVPANGEDGDFRKIRVSFTECVKVEETEYFKRLQAVRNRMAEEGVAYLSEVQLHSVLEFLAREFGSGKADDILKIHSAENTL